MDNLDKDIFIKYNLLHWYKYVVNVDVKLYSQKVILEFDIDQEYDKKKTISEIIDLNYDIFGLIIKKDSINPIIEIGSPLNENLVELTSIDSSEIDDFVNASSGRSFNYTYFKGKNKFYIVLFFHKMFFDIYSINAIVNQLKLDSPSKLKEDLGASNANFNYWSKIFNSNVPNLTLTSLQKNLSQKDFSYNVETLTKKIDKNTANFDLSTYLTAFTVLLNKYTNNKDSIIGVQLPQEEAIEHNGMLFPLHVNSSEGKTFIEFKDEMENKLKNSFENYIPLDELLKFYQYKEENLKLNPRFQIVFSYIETENIDILFNDELSAYLLNFNVIKCQDEIYIKVVFNLGEFEREKVNYFVENYVHTVSLLSQESKFLIDEISVASNYEVGKILDISKGKKNDNYLNKCIHKLFEDIVIQYPNNIAISFNGKQVTYSELNSKANKLARYLKETKGILPKSIIGICLERSEEAIISMLAILKIGGAYVPIDPNLPMDRIIYMMENSDLQTLITNERFGLAMPVFWSNVVCVDSITRELKKISDHNLSVEVSSNDLCYIIYTSGSTGHPKGAMLHHEGICNRILWGIDNQLSGKDDVILQRTTLSFDVSVWEIFGVLLSGGKLIILESDKENDIFYIKDLVVKNKITHLDFVPSQLKVFVNQKKIDQITNLKRITSAGETLSISLKNEVLNAIPCKLFNLYGPTEASLAVTYWECEKESNTETVPIGIPMDNTEVYILDANQNILPFGVIGEIYIGGKCLGKGYFNNQVETLQKFVNSKIKQSNSEFLYKTGDLGRINNNGYLEFLGRNDQQIKIRGYRIELDEIENVIESSLFVDYAITKVVGDEIDRRILCYLYLNSESNALNADKVISSVTKTILSKLPAYMVPSDFMIAPQIELTFNGKKDRSQLPDFVSFKNKIHNSTDLHSVTTIKVIRIFKEILNVDDSESLNLEENFFALGGNSLQLIVLIEKIDQEFGVMFNLIQISNKLSIRLLSEHIDLKKK